MARLPICTRKREKYWKDWFVDLRLIRGCRTLPQEQEGANLPWSRTFLLRGKL
jgi:hypothetical protein